jgi:hypothetical protein
LNHAQAKKQSIWRYTKLDRKTRDKLRDIQVAWQGDVQHQAPKSQRKERNKFLNDVMKRPPPAVLSVKGYLERGMSMDKSDAMKFLKNFKIGQNVLLPPCGFSADPGTARSFADDNEDVSIILRLMPKNGKTYGLALPYANWGIDHEKKEKSVEKKKPTEKEMDVAREKYFANKISSTEYYKIYNAYYGIDDVGHSKNDSFYDHEHEVIRPGWAKNKVVAVNRIIDMDGDDIEYLDKVRFENVLQEMGKGTKAKLTEATEPEEKESD